MRNSLLMSLYFDVTPHQSNVVRYSTLPFPSVYLMNENTDYFTRMFFSILYHSYSSSLEVWKRTYFQGKCIWLALEAILYYERLYLPWTPLASHSCIKTSHFLFNTLFGFPVVLVHNQGASDCTLPILGLKLSEGHFRLSCTDVG